MHVYLLQYFLGGRVKKVLLIDLLNKGFITVYFSFGAKSFYCVLI